MPHHFSHHFILRSGDDENLQSGPGQLTVRIPKAFGIRYGWIQMDKLIIGGAKKGPVWVSCSAAQELVLSGGKGLPLLGVFYCDGLRNKTYTFQGGDIWLPLRGATLNHLTVRLLDPETQKPIEFHTKNPSIVIHLTIHDDPTLQTSA